MDDIFNIVRNMTEEQKTQMYSEMMGRRFDGTVDYCSTNITEKELMQMHKRKQAQVEMVEYLTQCLRREYGLDDSEDALLLWEDYKEKHNILIEGLIADE